MPPALQDHLARIREVNPDVRAVNLLLDDQRFVGDERLRLRLAEMFVVVSSLRSKQMGRAGYLVKSRWETPIVRLLSVLLNWGIPKYVEDTFRIATADARSRILR